MFSFIQNAEFIVLLRLFWIFFCLLRPKSKMENKLFFKKNYMVFSCIMQNDEPKLKIF
jgi:hypothetical protein